MGAARAALAFYALFALAANHESLVFLAPWFAFLELSSSRARLRTLATQAVGFGAGIALLLALRAVIGRQGPVAFGLDYYLVPLAQDPLHFFRQSARFQWAGFYSVFGAAWAIPLAGAVSMCAGASAGARRTRPAGTRHLVAAPARDRHVAALHALVPRDGRRARRALPPRPARLPQLGALAGGAPGTRAALPGRRQARLADGLALDLPGLGQVGCTDGHGVRAPWARRIAARIAGYVVTQRRVDHFQGFAAHPLTNIALGMLRGDARHLRGDAAVAQRLGLRSVLERDSPFAALTWPASAPRSARRSAPRC
jgi:hypothetical protein